MKKKLLLTAAAAATLLGAPAHAANDHANVNAQLHALRQATAAYHSLDAAMAAGWDVDLTGCVANPDPAVGAMGHHYINSDIFFDADVDPLRPDVLVYAPTPSGGRQLVAVEWVVFTAMNPTPPQLFGQTFHLNPNIQAWVLHAWIWKPNPSGMFADFNPNVQCPSP